MKTVFLRALEAGDKAATLLMAIREPQAAIGHQRFEVDTSTFASVPRSPFAYWASNRILGLFTELEPFESDNRAARHGAATLNNGRFLRLAWEVQPVGFGSKWRPYAKGGAYSPFYDDVHLAVNWSENGAELKQFVSEIRERNGWGPHWTAVLNGYDYYLRPGLTWPSRTQSGFAPRILSRGCIFDCKGNAAFFRGDHHGEILGYLAILLSAPFRTLVGMQMTFGSYDVGVVQRTPIPNLSPAQLSKIAAMSLRAYSLMRRLDTHIETSHAFTSPALLQVEGDTLGVRAAAWSEQVHAIEAELATIDEGIDAYCFDVYGLKEADQRAIVAGLGSINETATTGDNETGADTETDGEEADENDAGSNEDTTELLAKLVSWAVGVAFGRFDVRLATGARMVPPEPEPFDPLPACSPGMLTGQDGLPLTGLPPCYPLAFPVAGILVDDLGHPQDLPTAVRAVFDAVFGANADRWWNDVAALLDPKGHNLRAWLAGSFFEYHLKHYSKSRRKAPILWQFGTTSGRYSVWLYAHRLTHDTLFQLQNEVVGLKLTHEEQRLTTLMQNAGGTPSASERKEIAAQEADVEELREMLDEVKRVAALWNPNLDDGVVLAMAPLWRLIPQHKPWQKELRAKWDELAAAKYDWAHQAMHLWPERIVPKCMTDRSLAIAHGLEEVFWLEGEDGKWKARPTPTKSVEELVRERTSLAVKAALESLLEVSGAVASNRNLRNRSARSAGDGGGA
jgi:hypothetical protein